MQRFSTGEPARIRLPGSEDVADAPVFLMRVASLTERALYEAELAGPPWNAGRVLDVQLFDALEDAVRDWYADDAAGAAELVGLLQRLRAGDPLSAPEEQVVRQLEVQALQHWPDYAALRQRRANRIVCAPLVALRRFLVGWENIDQSFEVGRDGFPTDATLSGLSADDRQYVGFLLMKALYPTADEGKASGSQPSSPPDPKPSKAARGRRTAAPAGK